MTMKTECSCTTTDTYRQLDRGCPSHGDLAQLERLSASIDASLANIDDRLDDLEWRFAEAVKA